MIYSLTVKFPRHEVYGLTNQMRRSALSIPCNIAEGFNRFHNKEYKQFLYIALGSCAEMETQIEIAYDLKYISGEEKNHLLSKLILENKMVRSLIKKL